MTNMLAITLLFLVAGFLALDHYVLHLDVIMFVFRKLIELINKMAFWR
jgi:hypothetical protein